MVFNTTFNNISVISEKSVLLVEETGVPGESHRPAVISHWQILSHNVVSSTPLQERGGYRRWCEECLIIIIIIIIIIMICNNSSCGSIFAIHNYYTFICILVSEDYL